MKITDFGTAKNLKDDPPFSYYVSTRWYRSPELILGTKTYDSHSDVFSLGLVFAEFYNLIPLFCGNTSLDQLNKYIQVLGSKDFIYWEEGMQLLKSLKIKIPAISECKLSEKLPGASEVAIDLLTQMLCINPNKRPSIDMILDHPFFAEEDTRIPFSLEMDTTSKSFGRNRRGFKESKGFNRSMEDIHGVKKNTLLPITIEQFKESM